MTVIKSWQHARRDQIRDDRGSESVELAIVLPIVVIVLLIVVAVARVMLATDRMNGVAGVAARDASIATSPYQARTLAKTGAQSQLTKKDLRCKDVRVTVDTTDFAAPAGTPAVVRVDVWCTVDLSDISITGLPGSKTLHDTATSPLDPARDLPGSAPQAAGVQTADQP